MNSFLKLKNISKYFNTEKKVKVLKNLSYNFNKGKMYALIGPSGSGKSTLLNLISLIDRPSHGSIKFNEDIVNFKNNKKNDIFRAENIGIVYQQNNLLTDFTALENVYMASLSVNNDKDAAIIKAKTPKPLPNFFIAPPTCFTPLPTLLATPFTPFKPFSVVSLLFSTVLLNSATCCFSSSTCFTALSVLATRSTVIFSIVFLV